MTKFLIFFCCVRNTYKEVRIPPFRVCSRTPVWPMFGYVRSWMVSKWSVQFVWPVNGNVIHLSIWPWTVCPVWPVLVINFVTSHIIHLHLPSIAIEQLFTTTTTNTMVWLFVVTSTARRRPQLVNHFCRSNIHYRVLLGKYCPNDHTHIEFRFVWFQQTVSPTADRLASTGMIWYAN